jgi:hypothetical protein
MIELYKCVGLHSSGTSLDNTVFDYILHSSKYSAPIVDNIPTREEVHLPSTPLVLFPCPNPVPAFSPTASKRQGGQAVDLLQLRELLAYFLDQFIVAWVDIRIRLVICIVIAKQFGYLY